MRIFWEYSGRIFLWRVRFRGHCYSGKKFRGSNILKGPPNMA
jgi:hypothetical protein